MKEFLAFVQKEFYHILRDKRTMLILLAMPIAMIVIFGFAISTELQNVNVGILSPNKTSSIRQITNKIEANKYFTIVKELNSSKEIEDNMKKGNIDLALVFNSNFNSDPKIQIVIDSSNPNVATSEMYYLSNILKDYIQESNRNINLKPIINTNIRMLYNPQMKSSYNFVPGIMGMIFILICALMTSVSIVREKERGSMEVLLVSPVKPIVIIFAKMVPYFVVSCANLLTILLLAFTLLQIPMNGSIFFLSIISLIYIFLSLAFGLLVSTMVKTQVAAMFASLLGLLLPVLMLSGMIFPIDNMPIILQGISNIVPAKWYISAVRKIMIQGLEFTYVLKETIILSLMSIFLIIIALKKYKNRLE